MIRLFLLDENHFAAVPVAVYGVVLLMAAIAYWLLQQKLIALEGPDSTLKCAVGSDWKSKLSPLAYISGIVASFWQPWVAKALYVAVALVWLVPDRRIECTLHQAAQENRGSESRGMIHDEIRWPHLRVE